MRFLADRQLYSSTEHCLDYLRDLPDAGAGGACRTHFFWHGHISRKHVFALKSFLATQQAPADQIWLWLDSEHGYSSHENNPDLQPLLTHVTVRRFDPVAEAAGTPLEDRIDLYTQVSAVRASNFVRFIVLFKYGGLYADLDTLFLRDLGPLWTDGRFSSEFCYRWSAHMPYANSAVLALREGSATARRLLERCRERNSCRPRDVLRFVEDADLDLLVLPCPFFDPLWPHRDRQDTYTDAPFDRFEDFFRRFGWGFPRDANRASIGAFFPGAFTYHWHNCWDAKEHPDSYFGLLEQQIDDVLTGRLGLTPGHRQR
jgi:hypothetical protein